LPFVERGAGRDGEGRPFGPGGGDGRAPSTGPSERGPEGGSGGGGGSGGFIAARFSIGGAAIISVSPPPRMGSSSSAGGSARLPSAVMLPRAWARNRAMLRSMVRLS
jgi:hypothetical protein